MNQVQCSDPSCEPCPPEMKNEELRKVRLQLSVVSNKDQELIEAKRSAQRLEQKIEDLTAMLSSKTDQERQLHQEKQQLRVSLDREAQVGCNL